MSALSTAVAGWFYRTGIFTACSISPFGRKATSNLGFPNYELTPEHVAQFTADPNYIIVKAKSRDDAERVVRDAVEKIETLQKQRR